MVCVLVSLHCSPTIFLSSRCDRIKPKEAEIRELFAKRRSAMSHVTPPDVADLLAASQDLLRIEQASNAKLRRVA